MSACILCKTTEGDVKKGLEELLRSDESLINAVKDNETPSVVQIGIRKYNNLKKATLENGDRDKVIEEIKKKHITHALNYKTLTIHKKDCPYAGKNTITAYIVNPEITGLHRCKHCM